MIFQKSKKGEFIKNWPSVPDAADELDISATNIYAVLRGKRGSAGGFVWSSPADNTVNEVLSEHNLEGKNWSSAWIKEDGISLHVKNPNAANKDITLEDFREEFKKFSEEYSPKSYKEIPRLSSDGHLLVIDIADLHIGKLGAISETGSNYNNDIAVKRAVEGVTGILQKASGFPISKILFVIGNDVLHVDNTKRTTTSGTPQDTDGMWFDNYKLAKHLYVSIIDQLVQVADVHVVHNPSNHDYMSGFMLADSVASWFNSHPNITFDITNAHRKYYKFGRNLISTSHGDGAKIDQLPLLMAHEAKEDWAQTDFRYIYLHHIHHKKSYKFNTGEDFIGVSVEYLRSPSGTDSWHHRNGYTGCIKAVEGFIHHPEHGSVCRLTHTFK